MVLWAPWPPSGSLSPGILVLISLSKSKEDNQGAVQGTKNPETCTYTATAHARASETPYGRGDTRHQEAIFYFTAVETPLQSNL